MTLYPDEVESAVEHLDSLSQPQALHVLTRLLQGDHLTPPATASSYTSRDRRSTWPADTWTATASLLGPSSPLTSPAHWPGSVNRCPRLCALGCTASRSESNHISTVPDPSPTCTVLPAHDHGTPYHAPSQCTYPSRPTYLPESAGTWIKRLRSDGSQDAAPSAPSVPRAGRACRIVRMPV